MYALAANSSGTLYAGGGFINLQRIAAADKVAYLAGGAWHAMGSGRGPAAGAVTDFVRSLTVDGTDVYVGTDSTDVAGIPQADHVARWNGSSWSALGSDTGGANGWFPETASINALVTSGSRVFASGLFLNANGDPLADHIAYFDGTAWHPFGSNSAGDGPFNANVSALAAFGQLLVAGGSFTAGGGNKLASFVASRPLFPDTTAPIITGYAIGPSTFKRLKSTIVRYKLSEASVVTLTMRRQGGILGTFVKHSNAGISRFAFSGRLNGKPLRPGIYRLVAVAVDVAGNRSTPISRTFRVTR